MVTPDSTAIDRRHFLSFGIAALAGATAWHPAIAQTAANASPTAPIERLDNALLATMKAANGMSFEARYATLEPIITQVFNLDAVLAASVGLSWATMPDAQKATLAQAFRRYTVSSYVSNFNSYKGQTFEIAPSARTLANGEVIVQTRLMRPNDAPLKLDYVMRGGTAGWQAVDVLTDGSISRVAVQRSDFRQLLASGGVHGLAAGLERKVSNLSGGMIG
jgi:phospholipid transport system substrate-binding protein